ncbi:hypothetical protein DENSPDRAFT_61379 [Dentipellis sp. KUC8613]|nr:hypothetical protein DENSPDRAFT_61379 [Dentipellis sp. KUC8613]
MARLCISGGGVLHHPTIRAAVRFPYDERSIHRGDGSAGTTLLCVSTVGPRTAEEDVRFKWICEHDIPEQCTTCAHEPRGNTGTGTQKLAQFTR